METNNDDYIDDEYDDYRKVLYKVRFLLFFFYDYYCASKHTEEKKKKVAN